MRESGPDLLDGLAYVGANIEDHRTLYTQECRHVIPWIMADDVVR
jgi:hypothetical protein